MERRHEKKAERRAICVVCGKSSAQPRDLIRHMKRKHPASSIECRMNKYDIVYRFHLSNDVLEYANFSSKEEKENDWVEL